MTQLTISSFFRRRLFTPIRSAVLCVMALAFISTLIAPVVMADSSCTPDATTTTPGGGLSTCQQELYSSGVYYFDITAGSDNTGSTCGSDGSQTGSTDTSTPGTAGLSGLSVSFVTKNYAFAQGLSVQYGIPWEAVVAQGIIESASGTSHFALTRNNFFGLGAVDSNPDAAYHYPTPEAGWKGYYDFIASNPRYRDHGVFKDPAITDPIAYIKDIKAAGYATDPTYVSKVGGVANAIGKLAATNGWQSSAQLAAANPEMLTNAAKYAAGSGSTGSTPGSGGSDSSDTSCSDGTSGGDSASLGVGKGAFKDIGEVNGYANVLANSQKTNDAFGDKLVGKGNCSFIVAIVWKGIDDPHIGFSGGAKNIWYEHKAQGHADRNVKKGAILIYSDSSLGHVAIYLGNNKVLNDGQIKDASYIEDSWHETYLGWIDPNDIGFPASQEASQSNLVKWLTRYESTNPYGV